MPQPKFVFGSTKVLLYGSAVFLALGAAVAMRPFFETPPPVAKNLAPASAVITSVSDQCRYVVKSIGQEVTVEGQTEFLNCAEARLIAEEEGHAFGHIERKATAGLEFETEAGEFVETSIVLHQNRIFFVGDPIEILYRIDNPIDVTTAEAASTPADPSPGANRMMVSTQHFKWALAVLPAIFALSVWRLLGPTFWKTLKHRYSRWNPRTPPEELIRRQSAPPVSLTSSGSGFYGPGGQHFNGR